MHTHEGAWIRSIPSASFIPLWGIYLVVILAAALFLIWRKQVSAVRSLTQHMQKPVMTLQDLVAFSGLSPYHATALRVYEQYLKGTVRISPEDGYIHELNETDEEKEDEQTPMLYLRAHIVRIREIGETNPATENTIGCFARRTGKTSWTIRRHTGRNPAGSPYV